MTRGTIISFNADDDEGYIDPDDGDERIPFDRESMEDFPIDQIPKVGARVSFVVEGGMAGLWAAKVRLLD